MKNFILAVTSFFVTVLLFSQIALAQEDGWDPRHTTPAPGDEPAMNLNAGRSNGNPQSTEGSSPDSGEANTARCDECATRRASVKRLGDNTTAATRSSNSGSDSSGSKGSTGTK